MPIALDQFAQQLVDVGLMSAADVAALRATSGAQDAEQLARVLVKQKRLTAFQAQQVYGGKAKGLVLGNYVILDKLGQGGMGMVLKAEHRRMKRVVALKVLSPSVTKTPELVARFHREVQAAARLEHPNIVSSYDADEAHGTHFFVMQYVDGQDLASLIKKKGTLAVEQAVSCMVQTARGLQFAHAHGVIHRDIKPANLLLDNQGVVKILDMGLARIEGDTGSQAEITQTGAVMGTVDYMAPEQARNTKAADARSDIYSLGISLWYLLVGKPAYDGATLTERLLAHQTDPIPSLRAARPEVPAALDAVFQRMVAKRPADRYQTMTDVIAALEGCLRGDASAAPSLATGVSEDSQFNAFLAGLAQTDAGPQTAGGRKSAAATAVASSDVFGATQAVSQSDSGTDPQTVASLARESKSRAAKGAWWQDRRVQIGGGVAVLLVTLSLLIPRGQRDAAPTPAASPPPTAAALPAGAEYALEFDGNAYVKIPTLSFSGEPVTLEAWIEPGLLSSGCYLNTSAPGHAASLWGGMDINGFTTTTPAGTRVGRQMERLETGRWYHVAGVFDGDTASYFVDGRLISQSASFSEQEPANLQGGWIGGILDVGLWRGRIREARFSKSARYTATFTPSREFDKDANTLALYRFDEGQGTTLNDESGHSHHGTIVRATWIVDDPKAKSSSAATGQPFASQTPKSIAEPDYALQFDGESSYVELPWLVGFPGPQTIEAYVTPARIGRNDTRYQLVVSLAGNNNGLLGQYHGHWTATFSQLQNDYGQESAEGTAMPDQRVHLAAVWDGQQTTLFVDGQKSFVERGKTTKTHGPAAGLLGAGRVESDGRLIHPFAGLIDEVRISKVARYSSDFQPQPRLASDAETLALYHCDDGQGARLTDHSGNGHHGKIVNAKWVGGPAGDESSVDLPLIQITSDQERALLDEFRQHDARIHVVFNGETRLVDGANRLPSQPFALEKVDLEQAFGLTSKDVARLAAITAPFYLTTPTQLPEDEAATAAAQVRNAWMLILASPQAFTAQTGRLLGNHPVQYLVISGREVQPGSLTALKSLPRLRALLLQRCTFDRATLAEVNQLPHLRSLNLEGSTVSDADLPVLTRSDLKTLALYGTAVTAQGLAEFQRRMPQTGLAGVQELMKATSVKNYALEFDGKSHVQLPALDLISTGSVTFEVSVWPQRPATVTKDDFAASILSSKDGLGFGLVAKDRGIVFEMGTVYMETVGGNNAWELGSPWDGRRRRIAAVVDGERQMLRLFVDGHLAQEFRFRGALHAGPVPMMLGADPNAHGQPGNWFTGRLDEVRISRVARYAADYVPADRLESDAETLVLYHCDEGQGDVLKDSSGHNQHGKIIGATWTHLTESAASATAGHQRNLLDPERIDRIVKSKPGAQRHPEGLVLDGLQFPNTDLSDEPPRQGLQESTMHADFELLSPPQGVGYLSLGYYSTAHGSYKVSYTMVPNEPPRLEIRHGTATKAEVLATVPGVQDLKRFALDVQLSGGQMKVWLDGRMVTQAAVPSDAFTGAAISVKNSKWLVREWTLSEVPPATPSKIDPLVQNVLTDQRVDTLVRTVAGVERHPEGILLDTNQSNSKNISFGGARRPWLNQSLASADVELLESHGSACTFGMGFRFNERGLLLAIGHAAPNKPLRWEIVEVLDYAMSGSRRTLAEKTINAEWKRATLTVQLTGGVMIVRVNGQEVLRSNVPDHNLSEMIMSAGHSKWLVREWTLSEVPSAAVSEIDLLKLLDLKRDVVSGDWQMRGSSLATPAWKEPQNRLQWSVPKPMPDEYDVELDIEREEAGGTGLSFGFVMGGRQAVVNMDAYSTPKLWALQDINGKSGRDNPTRNPGQRLPVGERKQIVIQVRREQVQVLLGGETIIDWHGKPEQLSTTFWTVPDKQALFLGSQSKMLIHRAVMKPR